MFCCFCLVRHYNLLWEPLTCGNQCALFTWCLHLLQGVRKMCSFFRTATSATMSPRWRWYENIRNLCAFSLSDWGNFRLLLLDSHTRFKHYSVLMEIIFWISIILMLRWGLFEGYVHVFCYNFFIYIFFLYLNRYFRKKSLKFCVCRSIL